jgi:hypothetical protein
LAGYRWCGALWYSWRADGGNLPLVGNPIFLAEIHPVTTLAEINLYSKPSIVDTLELFR